MSGYTFNNSVVRWIDSRLPIFSFLMHEGVDYPTPRNFNYWYNFGFMAGLMLVIMVVSGIFLAMHYTPHASEAFNSVERIRRDVNFGEILRNIHMNGASFFFIVVYIHIFRGLYYGSYKAPRELLWWIGLVIFLIMMATAFLGYVLPWGQMSFWGATVITKLFSAIPWVGDTIVTWLWGGFSVDNPTLNRFFALHYLLPFVLFAVVFVHLWALHTVKSGNPLGVEMKEPTDSIPFHPYYTVKDLYTMAILLLVFVYFVFFNPDFFGEADNYIPANPMSTPPHIVPEWYFLPFYAILRSIDNKLLGVIAMFGSILILFFLPWLDTSKVRSGRFRPIFKIFFWLFLINGLILGYIGSQAADAAIHLGSRVIELSLIGQISTAWYFLHFLLILPIVGFVEKPLPLPYSISAAVLKSKTGSQPKE